MNKYIKIITFLFVFIQCSVNILNAQLYDKNWVMGFGGYLGYPGFILSFDQNGLTQKVTNTKMRMSLTNISMSNEKGELQFYTNGQKVLNNKNQLIENGYNLLDNNLFINQNNDDYSKDYVFTAAFECFQDTKNKNLYYLYQDYYDTLNISINSESDTNFAVTKLTLTKIDMSENGGLGKVIYKNKKIYDSQNYYKKVSVQHANGQYWWSILNHINGKDYTVLLIDNDSIKNQKKYSLDFSSKTQHGQAETQKCISQDGSLYLDLRGNDEIRIFDFDRCSGKLELKRKIPFIDDKVNNKSFIWGSIAIAISSNNRFIYLGRSVLNSVNPDEFYTYLLQLDLEDNDPWKNRIVITDDLYYIEEGSGEKYGVYIWHFQQGMDGKLYFIAGGDNTPLYVIQNPNKKGKECGFCDTCIILPSYNSISIPNFPNYRLGPLKGSPCDTILGVANQELNSEKDNKYALKVSPNPATDRLVIEVTMKDYSQKDTELLLYDITGKEVSPNGRDVKLPEYAYISYMDVSKLPTGIYTLHLKVHGQTVATDKVVVMR